MTDLSTTCAEAIFRVKSLDSEDGFRTGCRNNSRKQQSLSDSNHRDDLFQSRNVTPGFKPFYCFRFNFRHPTYTKFKFPTLWKALPVTSPTPRAQKIVACVASVSVANFDVLAARNLRREQKKKRGEGERSEGSSLLSPLSFLLLPQLSRG